MDKDGFWYKHVRGNISLYIPHKKWYKKKKWVTVLKEKGSVRLATLKGIIYEAPIMVYVKVCTNSSDYNVYCYHHPKYIGAYHPREVEWPDHVSEIIKRYIALTNFSNKKFINAEGDDMSKN